MLNLRRAFQTSQMCAKRQFCFTFGNLTTDSNSALELRSIDDNNQNKKIKKKRINLLLLLILLMINESMK
jgi:hypothetical protein